MLKRRTKIRSVDGHSILTEGYTHRNEQVWNLSFVLEPGLPVLGAATLDITQGPVADHARKEDRVEPREGTAEAGDKTPVQRKI